MRNLLIAASLVAALTGCSALPEVGEPAVDPAEQQVDGFLSELGQFTANDLQVAMKLTGDRDLDGAVDPDVPNGDPVALQCYVYLHGRVSSAGNGDSITVAGAVSAFQSARNIRRRIDNGVSDEFQLACGPLINDVRSNVRGVIARVASGGVLPF